MTYKGEKFVDAREAEQERLRAFEARGGLDQPAYAVLPGMDNFSTLALKGSLGRFGEDLKNLNTPGVSETGFDATNGYFGAPDSDVYYLMLRDAQPKHVIEVGCGHSTRVARQAILDGDMDTRLTAIDPFPRKDVDHLVDVFHQTTLEAADPALFDSLDHGDILFIDSSHQVRMSNDVAHLFCRIIPRIAPGVLIHVHDVFLPYEYPKRFFYDCPGWGEQYVLHALLQGGGYDILWPGYFLQRSHPETENDLPFLKQGRAQSFWMRKI
jgi:hypothetical protein